MNAVSTSAFSSHHGLFLCSYFACNTDTQLSADWFAKFVLWRQVCNCNNKKNRIQIGTNNLAQLYDQIWRPFRMAQVPLPFNNILEFLASTEISLGGHRLSFSLSRFLAVITRVERNTVSFLDRTLINKMQTRPSGQVIASRNSCTMCSFAMCAAEKCLICIKPGLLRAK